MIYDVNSFFLLAFINRSYYQLNMEVVCQFYPLFSNGAHSFLSPTTNETVYKMIN